MDSQLSGREPTPQEITDLYSQTRPRWFGGDMYEQRQPGEEPHAIDQPDLYSAFACAASLIGLRDDPSCVLIRRDGEELYLSGPRLKEAVELAESHSEYVDWVYQMPFEAKERIAELVAESVTLAVPEPQPQPTLAKLPTPEPAPGEVVKPRLRPKSQPAAPLPAVRPRGVAPELGDGFSR